MNYETKRRIALLALSFLGGLVVGFSGFSFWTTVLWCGITAAIVYLIGDRILRDLR